MNILVPKSTLYPYSEGGHSVGTDRPHRRRVRRPKSGNLLPKLWRVSLAARKKNSGAER